MNRFCLIGHPLGHSVSPEIQQKLFRLNGLSGEYILREIVPGELGGKIAELQSFDGFNITIPYKKEIIPFLNGVSEKAGIYESVNTVKNENGRLIGYNTDAEGFRRALAAFSLPLEGRVLLCGAGGVASTIACTALQNGCALTVAARNFEKAAAFCDGLRSRFPGKIIEPSFLKTVSGRFDLVVNATPAGMLHYNNENPVPEPVLRAAGGVFDTVYNPAQTPLLQRAGELGIKCGGGMPMLVWQAAAAQEIWLGVRFRDADIEQICREMQSKLGLSNTPSGKR